MLFQSTRPLRGATWVQRGPEVAGLISIHAPLAGRDLFLRRTYPELREFQSTRPLRGATPPTSGSMAGWPYFNPRAPCGARPAGAMRERTPDAISIHAPLAGRDPTARRPPCCGCDFNPRAPCGARRCQGVPDEGIRDISIHAPLAGRDLLLDAPINPVYIFQSTRPLRGATTSPCGITPALI